MNDKTIRKIKNTLPHGMWKVMVSFARFLRRIKYKTIMTCSSKKLELYCPCCGIRFKSFGHGDYDIPDFYDVSLFEGYPQDVRCNVCGSLPRHRILTSWCIDNKDLLTSKKILYFAPETCVVRWFKANKMDYTTADLYNVDAELKLDITNTGLPDNSYDVVMCNHVLEHVDDVMTALLEMKRIIRPGGFFICSFPVNPNIDLVDEDKSVTTEAERLKRYGQSDHVRLFGINADRFMRDAGFDVSFIEGKDYPDEILPITAPSKYDINRLYLCKVRK